MLDIFGEVARGHALVHLLVTGEAVELLDARLHIVAGDPFAFHDRAGVDLILHLFVSGDRFGGDVEAEVALGLHHGDPELAFEDDAALGRPDGLDFGGGVAFGEDVGDHAAEHGRLDAAIQASLGTNRARCLHFAGFRAFHKRRIAP